MTIKFENKTHKERYDTFLARMKSRDSYHKSAAYLLALSDFDGVENQVFNFQNDRIRPEALKVVSRVFRTFEESLEM